MKKILLILFLTLICLVSTSAQSKLAQLKALYPTADAVYLRQEKSFTLNDNGSMDYHYYHQLLYLTPYAFNSLYGESFILYNPEFQTLKINVSETLTPDGRKIVSPANAFNEVLPLNAANAPAYNQLKEMVVSHTALEVGAIVTLDYVIHSNRDYVSNLIGNEQLITSSPIQEMRFEINLPMSKKLNVGSFNIPSQPVVQAHGIMQSYTWELKNIASDVNEPLFPVALKPRIVFSTEDLSADFKQLNDAVTGQLEGDLQKWVNDIVAVKTTESEKAFALQKAVATEMNNYGVSMDQTAYRYRKANDVFLSNGGTEVEKTILLANLLKSVGIAVEVVGIVPVWMLNDDKAENLLMISHYYVRTSLGKKVVCLSAIEVNAADPTKSFDGVLVVDQYGNQVSKATADNISVTGKLSITNEKKLLGELIGSFENAAVPYYALQRNAASLTNLFPLGITPKGIKANSTTNVVASFSVNQALPAEINGGYSSIVLPEVNTGLSKFRTFILPTSRKTLFHFPALMNESYAYRIQIKKGGELLNPQVNILQKTDFAEMQISIQQKKKGATISVVRSFKLLKQDFSPAEYTGIANMMAVWFDKQYQVLVLK